MRPRPVPPYPALSRGERGSFEWAIDQLRAGNEVRRWGWPIEVTQVQPNQFWKPAEAIYVTRIWHLYTSGETMILKGFSSGVCGADNDAWGYLGTDSMGYSATPEDRVAIDWQLVADVTPAQVAYCDAHRWPRIPNIGEASNAPAIHPVILPAIMTAVVLALLLLLFTGRISFN